MTELRNLQVKQFNTVAAEDEGGDTIEEVINTFQPLESLQGLSLN